MSLWQRILDTLIDPNLISLMLSLGVLGIVIELWHPGLIFPATFGVLSLAIAFFGLDVLPDQLGRTRADLRRVRVLDRRALRRLQPRRADGRGRRLLRVRVAAPVRAGRLRPTRSRCSVALSVAVTFSLFFVLVLAKVLQIRRRPAAVGTHMLVGAHGHVRRDGLVAVSGELWQAEADDGEPLEPGEEVDVVGIEGLALRVRRSRTPTAV